MRQALAVILLAGAGLAVCHRAATQVPPSSAEIAAYGALHAAAQRGDGDAITRLAGDGVLVDGALETERRSAQVANGGEAAHQRVCRLGAGHEIVVADVTQRLCGSHPYKHRVPMRVDQAGHQRAAVAVDSLHGHARRVDNGRARDRPDDVTDHENVGRPRKLPAGPVEDPNILEEHARWRVLRMCWRREGAHHEERGVHQDSTYAVHRYVPFHATARLALLGSGRGMVTAQL